MGGIDLVIFDCDGVLVDSEVIAVRIDQQVLAAHGWHLEIDEIVHRFVGRSDSYFRGELERHIGRTLPDDWDADFHSLYADAFDAHLQRVDGIDEVLDGLDGVARCVASSGTHRRIRRSLTLTGLLPRFADEHLFSVEDVTRGKPAPDLFLHAAASMGVEPSRCVVVEDSRHGVDAARAAGMHAFGYAGGLTPPEWLTGPGTTVFSDMRELSRLIAARA